MPLELSTSPGQSERMNEVRDGTFLGGAELSCKWTLGHVPSLDDQQQQVFSISDVCDSFCTAACTPRRQHTAALRIYNALQGEVPTVSWAPGQPHTGTHLSDNLHPQKKRPCHLKIINTKILTQLLVLTAENQELQLVPMPLLPAAPVLLVFKKSVEGESACVPHPYKHIHTHTHNTSLHTLMIHPYTHTHTHTLTIHPYTHTHSQYIPPHTHSTSLHTHTHS